MVKRILLVDDEEMILLLMKKILEEENYEVEVASNGIECGIKLYASQYDLILMDLNMPEMDGLKTIKYLRNGISQTHRSLNIFVLSAYVTPQVRVELEKLNIRVFDKPVKMNALLAAIREL